MKTFCADDFVLVEVYQVQGAFRTEKKLSRYVERNNHFRPTITFDLFFSSKSQLGNTAQTGYSPQVNSDCTNARGIEFVTSFEDNMPKISVNGIDLYFEKHGCADRTIVFAHGKGGNHMSWWQQIPELVADFTCITFDHRSFGFSTNAPDGRNQTFFVEDLLALMDHLELSKVSLVGQSMGGRTCLDFALRHPERVNKMVLASTIAGVVDPALQRLLSRHASPPSQLLPRVLSEKFRSANQDSTFLFQSIESINHIDDDPIALKLVGASRSAVQQCEIDTLLIVGDQDLVAPHQAVSWLAQELPTARLELVADCGHSVYFEQPRLFNHLVREHFLA